VTSQGDDADVAAHAFRFPQAEGLLGESRPWHDRQSVSSKIGSFPILKAAASERQADLVAQIVGA
jgi:hypothetical protein